MQHRPGRHFLQIPGPTNVPLSVLHAMAQPTIDHRGPAFAELVLDVLPRLGRLFGTTGPVVTYTASGTGAWEAALVNTLSPGDRVLSFDTGHFAGLWRALAARLGLDVELVAASWRHGVRLEAIGAALAADSARRIKAVMVVHNETSTGVRAHVPEIRSAIDAVGHPALLLVDAVSSLGSMDYRHDEWGVDVTVGASQKGMMLPPGLSFNAVSTKALDASKRAKLARAYWAWDPIIAANRDGAFPWTPATNLLFGLREALRLLDAEGLDNVFARHERHAEATRRAVRAWGLDVYCLGDMEHSSSVTAVQMGERQDADALRLHILNRYDVSLGAGLGTPSGRVFRIGHLGDLNDVTLLGTLSAVEMGLNRTGVSLRGSGVAEAMSFLQGSVVGVST